jgi:hypothetical protein
VVVKTLESTPKGATHWSTRQIKHGAHKSVAALKAAIEDFLTAHNNTPKPFVWTKSADDILASIARVATRSVRNCRPDQLMPAFSLTGY